MLDAGWATPPEFDAIRSEPDLCAFVERFRLKALRAHPASAQTLGEWSGAIDGRAVFVRSRRVAAPHGPRGAWVQQVSMTVGTAAGGPLSERTLYFAVA